MLLAADIGNSNIHLGLWDGTGWQASWRASVHIDRTSDEWAVLLRGFLAEVGLTFAEIDGLVLCSVVPPLVSTFERLGRRVFGREPLIVHHSRIHGLKINLDFPEQVGADRLANAVAAHHLYNGRGVLVLDCGTATKLEFIHAGIYEGGAIAPGLRGMMDSLALGTAQLYRVEFAPPPNPIGKNTVHAIQSGVFMGYIGLVESLITRFKATIDEPLQVVATGGWGGLIATHSEMIDELAPNLTLEGLRIIAAQNGLH